MQIIDIEEEKRPVMDIENEVDHSHQNKKKYEIIISKKGPQNTKGYTEAEFDSHRRTCILKLSTRMDLPESLSELILEKNGWDLQKALDDALENPKYYPLKGEESETNTKESVIVFECPACWNEVRNEETITLSCGHSSCEMCLKSYINTNFQRFPLKCLEQLCQAPIDESLILKYLNSESYELYEHLKNQNAMTNAGNFTWCPSKNCQRAIQLLVKAPGAKNLRCDCGISFCSECKELSHKPASCQMIENWKSISKYVDDERLTELWMKKNAKKCPTCGTLIQKNGGCPHMTCKACTYEFCWTCLESWKDHIGNHFECIRTPKSNLDFNKATDNDSLPDWKKICQATSLERCQKVAAAYQSLEPVIYDYKSAEFLPDTCNIILQAERALLIAEFLLAQLQFSDMLLIASLKLNVADLTKLTQYLSREMEKVMTPEGAFETLVTIRDNNYHLIGKFYEFETSVCTKTDKLVWLCNSVISDIEILIENQRSIDEQLVLAAAMSEYDEALPLECYQDAFQGGSQERQSQSQLFPAVSSSTVVKMVEN